MSRDNLQNKYSIVEFFSNTYTFDVYCFLSKNDRDECEKYMHTPTTYPIIFSSINNIVKLKCDSNCTCGKYCVKRHFEISKYKLGNVYRIGVRK